MKLTSAYTTRNYTHVTPDEIKLIHHLAAAGLSSRKISATLEIPRTTVQRYTPRKLS